MQSAWAQTYLQWLGLSAQTPSLPALTHLTERHLLTVPFENVTTLLRYRDNPPPMPNPNLEQLVDGWHHQAGGGLCYEISRALGQLLSMLGYSVAPITGTITWPDSHEALLVQIDQRRYLVDVGNGAPFFHPIPVDDVTTIDHAGLRYRFLPQPPDHLIQERYVAEVWQPFCDLTLVPRAPEELTPGYQRHHQPGEGRFVAELMLVRADATHLWALNNATFTEYSPKGRHRQQLGNAREFVEVAADGFHLPHLPILDAIRVLEKLGCGLA